MHNYIITRFNVLDVEHFGCNFKNKYTPDILFNKDRLDYRSKVFDMITYPSIKAQTYQNYTWWIFTSPDLPEEYSKKLDSYANSQIQIVRVKSVKEMSEYIQEELKDVKNYSTSWLDDDDGLCPEFLMNLKKYENETGKIVSCPSGKKFILKDDKIKWGSNRYVKNDSMGITGIGFNIMSIGKHMHVHERFKVLYDDIPEAYYVCCSEYSDSGRKFD